MSEAHATINQMLVTLFHRILRIEERALSFPGLSIREVHVIEAVCEEPEPRMNTLSQQLRVTAGSLSVAVSTLERKGYLIRKRCKEDRRAMYIYPSEKALEVQAKHKAFHQEMIAAIMEQLTQKELDILVKALDKIDSYFNHKEFIKQ